MSTESISARLSAQIRSLEQSAVKEIYKLLGIRNWSALSQAEQIEIAKKDLLKVNQYIAKLEKYSWLSPTPNTMHEMKLKRAAITMFINGMSPQEISQRIGR